MTDLPCSNWLVYEALKPRCSFVWSERNQTLRLLVLDVMTSGGRLESQKMPAKYREVNLEAFLLFRTFKDKTTPAVATTPQMGRLRHNMAPRQRKGHFKIELGVAWLSHACHVLRHWGGFHSYAIEWHEWLSFSVVNEDDGQLSATGLCCRQKLKLTWKT